MIFGTEDLKNIFDRIDPAFRDKAAIAGGAVRDAILGRTPRDIDIFFFGSVSYVRFAGLGVVPTLKIKQNYDAPNPKDDDRSWERIFPPYKLQFIRADRWASSLEGLIASFDWNICGFAYTETGLKCFENPTDLYPGGSLLIRKGAFTYPKRAFRRGKEFAARYRLDLPHTEVKKLAAASREMKKEKYFQTQLNKLACLT